MNAACRILLVAAICLSMGTATAARAQALELGFEFRATINGSTTPWHTFGLRTGAQPGFDSFDLPEPPPPPGFPFQIYLAMFEPLPGLPNRWLSEFRPAAAGTGEEVELWQIIIESPAQGANCRLEVRNLTYVATSYDLFLIGQDGSIRGLSPPAVVDFPVSGAAMTCFFELRVGEAVAVERETWGDVKALFRR